MVVLVVLVVVVVGGGGGGGGGGEAAILAAIANLNGRFDGLEGCFDDLVEEVRVTNRTTAILANNNSFWYGMIYLNMLNLVCVALHPG